ncbi:unnamed protein product [Microthlaspi erraticum]|uniref:Pentatricopeptide repeat-containing protein n=1 Tax=Microthlaspi erraticum TaxID=1685480 RepID=A0A6D2IPK2_9BRAS|nr:unnamed protein product [Microthlaspi erraticum]
MSLMLSFSWRQASCNLLSYPRFLLCRFSVPSGNNPESHESIVAEFLEKIPQHKSLGSLLTSSSSVSLSQITRRLGSYLLALSFLEFLNAKSQSGEYLVSLVIQSVIEFAGSEPDARKKPLRLYEIAKEKNIQIVWTYGHGLVQNRRVDDGFQVLEEMLQKGSVFPPNRITLDIVLSEVWKGRRHTGDEIATLILRFSSHSLFPNTVWLTRFLSSMCRRTSRTDEVWKVLSELMKNKAPLEAPPFNALLTCLARNREIVG